jgi:hypothetical protein
MPNDNLPSAFNPTTFLDTTIEGPLETRRTTVPAKDGYLAVIDDVKTRVVESKQGARVILDVFWELVEDEVKTALNMTKVTVRQNIFLDFDETGKLAKGINQNIVLGQVREAVGQNGVGAWAPRMLKGAGPCRLKVSERVDERNVAIKYNDVDRVTRLS